MMQCAPAEVAVVPHDLRQYGDDVVVHPPLLSAAPSEAASTQLRSQPGNGLRLCHNILAVL
jgi:hypothetical protein